MKKVVFLLILVFTISGCGKNELEPNYEKMQIGNKGINGYDLYLSVYGVRNGLKIDDNVIIENYNNEEFKITIKNANKLGKEKPTNEVIYVLNDKTYVLNKYGKYTTINEDIPYNNTTIYLDGIKNLSKISEPKKEKIGSFEYSVYDVTYSKDVLKGIIADTNIGDIKVNSDITGKIYIDKEGYVYRVTYVIDDITIIANYYGINNATEIDLPNEIESR